MKRNKIIVLILSIIIICLIFSNVIVLCENTRLNKSAIEFANNDRIIYRGMIVDTSLSIQNTSSPNSKSEYNEDNFNGLYNNYSNGKFAGKTVAFTEDSVYEDCFEIMNVHKIAIAKEYNPIPREIEYYDGEIFGKNKELQDIRKNNNIEVQSIKVDLDGNGTNEYIVCIKDIQNIDSTINIYNENGEKIDTLVFMKSAYWANIKSAIYEQFINIDNIEVLDIDEDGKMEILIESPAYVGYMLSIFKYDEENIIGETNIDVGIYLAS